jgi:hypothetical protein
MRGANGVGRFWGVACANPEPEARRAGILFPVGWVANSLFQNENARSLMCRDGGEYAHVFTP